MTGAFELEELQVQGAGLKTVLCAMHQDCLMNGLFLSWDPKNKELRSATWMSQWVRVL